MILLQLLWSFTKIGFTSFGGLSMIPLISSEMQVHQWMTAEEVSDIVAIAEMTPGPLGLNCATFAGMRTAGLPGAIAANLGVLMPTLTVCALAALFFQRFRNFIKCIGRQQIIMVQKSYKFAARHLKSCICIFCNTFIFLQLFPKNPAVFFCIFLQHIFHGSVLRAGIGNTQLPVFIGLHQKTVYHLT